MSMFGFDERYPMFDVTPVDNQFILEYLPNATGDAVRVYLYGLMQCYHPQTEMSVEQMARELGMTEEGVLTAYRHWERKGLVRRISDKPPEFRYIAVKQTYLMGGEVPVDQEYESFAAAVYGVFGNDRRLHGKEISQCYEWVEEYHLPAETVIRLLEHMVRLHGKSVAIKTVEKRAMQLVEEKVQSAEDVDVVLGRDKAVWDGCRAVIRRMGKRRNPSEDEEALYRKWLVDWSFKPEDILAACVELTRGDPNFKYLDGILSRLYAKRTATGVEKRVEDTIAAERDAVAPLKSLLSAMNIPGVTINQGTIAVYEEMRALYPDNIILMAGQECARHGLALDDVMRTLNDWKRNGLHTAEDVRVYMQRINNQNEFLCMIYDIMGMKANTNAADRRLAAKWLDEWGFEMSFVAQVASLAQGKERPMGYLDKLLEIYRNKGIRTIAQVQAEREQHQQSRQEMQTKPMAARGPKVVGEQQYTQREYTNSEDAADELMKMWQEGNGNA